MHWIFSQYSQLPPTGSIANIHRVSKSDKAHKTRICPQWISTYNEEEHALFIWIAGTRNHWDWNNLLNVRHKEIELQSPEMETIWVHQGVYNAINNVLFYAPLFADVHIHFSDPQQRIDRIIFGGHSQVWYH